MRLKKRHCSMCGTKTRDPAYFRRHPQETLCGECVETYQGMLLVARAEYDPYFVEVMPTLHCSACGDDVESCGMYAMLAPEGWTADDEEFAELHYDHTPAYKEKVGFTVGVLCTECVETVPTIEPLWMPTWD